MHHSRSLGLAFATSDSSFLMSQSPGRNGNIPAYISASRRALNTATMFPALKYPSPCVY